jgi:hypothetical protein
VECVCVGMMLQNVDGTVLWSVALCLGVYISISYINPSLL